MILVNKNRRFLKALVYILELLCIMLISYLLLLPFYPEIKYKADSKNNYDYKDINVVKNEVEKILSEENIDIKEESNSEEDLVLDEEKLDLFNAGDELALDKNNELSEDSVKPVNKQIKSQVKQNIASSTQVATNNIAKKTSNKKKPVNTEVKTSVKPAVNKLIIPKIKVNIPIIESDNEEYGLNHGAWRLPNSSTPKESGNMVITGHRFKYLPPSNLTFYLFNKLEKGDIASIIWNNQIYYYKINEVKVVSADDTSILKQSKKPILTMYTCDPIYSTKNRLVVIGEIFENK